MKEKAFSLHNGLAAKRNGLQSGLFSWQWTKIFLLVLLYYPMSVGLTFYQKWFIKSYKFPLLVVCIHYVIKFIGAALLRRCHRIVKGRDRATLPWNDCLRCVAPIGVAASIDIGLSNWALEYITVSLYTMSKSTCIVFILIFSILLSLEKLRVSLLSVVLLISAGLFLFTYQSQQFDLTGFMLVELAALCGGLRWAVSQFVMQRDEMGLHNPIDMIYHVQPWMIVCIIPLVLVFEGELWTEAVVMYDHQFAPLHILTLIFCGGMIALCMELAEYLLLVNTSGLTLNIFGILKEIITLALAHQFNGDQFSSTNMIGLMLCLSGILLHVVLKAWSRSSDVEDKETSATKALLTAGQEPSDSDGDR